MIVSEATKLSERKRRAVGRLIVGFEGLEPSSEMLDVLSGYTPRERFCLLAISNRESKRYLQSSVVYIVEKWRSPMDQSRSRRGASSKNKKERR